MDIETVNIENKLEPYLVCFFDGVHKYSFFITDYLNYDELILDLLKKLCVIKYKNYKVYLHNLSRFDSVFLINTLSKVKDAIVDPVITDGKVISIQLTYNNVIINFRDSYLLLPTSLKKLGLAFNNIVTKDIFPVLLNDINYKGEVPDFSNFVNISLEDYLSYCKNFIEKDWIFKDESINYCYIDCISLYEILIKFKKLIYDHFNVSINNYSTLPSLTFGIFRTKYLKENTIACINDSMFTDIKVSYTGGSVDMYIPFNNDNELIYAYDVNSLYPFVMLSKYMPIGKPVYFKGDILKFEPEAFGFFYCEILTPDNLLHPIIQTHFNTNDGIRTVSPLGSFSTMLFSEEVKYALSLGYKIYIKWGYTFDKGEIFKEYIEKLYNIRISYSKDQPMNFIAKILMNSLFGKMGQRDNFNETIILSKSEYDIFESKFSKNIVNIVELENKILVKYNMKEDNLNLDNLLNKQNINVAIASAITAYSRLHMTQFKNNPDYKLFYSDTDSIYINRPLPDHLVSQTEIGLMKLENIIKKGIFLAPKVYALLTEDNKVIIKVKGLNKEGIEQLSLEDFENLLFKDNSKKILQNKWFRNIALGNIIIKNQMYTLKATENKRNLIYNNEDKLVSTSPLIINT